MNEHKHKAIVSGWLVKYGITEIFWEQANEHDIPVFELEGASGRPDMLLRANDRWVVVEFKIGDRLTKALDAKYELFDYLDYDLPEWPVAERFDAKMFARDMWKLYKHLGYDWVSDPTVGILTSERFDKEQTKHYQWFDDPGPWRPSMMHNHNGGWYEPI